MPTEPATIGRYRVLGLLGHGAMGNVYLAEDPRLKRKVAIKVVREDFAVHGQAMERFNREAEISARLNHPNIITIFDVGEDPGAGAFLAMEYVKGCSLAVLIKERRPGPETALRLLAQAMRALQAAGEDGIVHRDVKPENILVGEDGRVKLMDFGIARGEESRLTATGVFLGTPSFTAPELLLGKEPSQATDRYAFAVTAFELLTGCLPYPGDSLGSTLYKVVNEPPRIPAETPAELAAVFRKALAKEPGERYGDLADFLRDLVRTHPFEEGKRDRLLGLLEGESAPALPPESPVAAEEPLPTTLLPRQSHPAGKRLSAQAAVDRLLSRLLEPARNTPTKPAPRPQPPSVDKLLGQVLPRARPQPSPRPETLVRQLEDALADIDVQEAITAQDHREAEELLHQLESDLEDAKLPGVE